MAHILAQMSWAFDSALPRDRQINTLHFQTGLAHDDSELANDLADLWDVWTGPQVEIQARLYDGAQGATGPPLAIATRSAGLHANSASPREVALCLSFRGEQNLPRWRGRIYWPAGSMWTGVGIRPALVQRQNLLDVAQGLANIGGVDIDWSVYSRTDNELRPVKLAWVDDEWDTMRSRGLRATTRNTLTLSE